MPTVEQLRCPTCKAPLPLQRRRRREIRGHVGLTPIQIREFRRSIGYSQAKLAHELGITVASLSAWETGKHGLRRSSYDKIRRLAEMHERGFR